MLSLGEQCISGAFTGPDGREPVQRAIPLELVRCDMTRDQDACGLLQIRHTVPGSILYSNYWYRSGVNRTMTKNLHEIAQEAEGLVELRPGDLVVDIGCNDGTLFDGYQVEGLRYLGFDPSDLTRYAVEKGYDIVRDFYSFERLQQLYPDRKARVITSIAMFYDLEDPGAFVEDVVSALSEDGVWAMELHYMPTMLERNAFDVIVHEHLEYFSLAVIERLITQAGLETIRAKLNDINGGSIRLFFAHAGRISISDEDQRALQDIRIREFEMALESPEPYERFRQGAERVRGKLREVCESLHREGKTIHIYGASTKGNTILQYANLDVSLIPYAADRNPDKWGSKTISTNIPIISEEESRRLKPDYFLVLPWHFLDEFLEREEQYLSEGGHFIVPLPEVRILPG